VWNSKLSARTQLRHQGSLFAHFGPDTKWLDGLDFNMRLSARAFELRVAPLIDLYASVTGHQDIPADFVIPSEASWPEKVWGVHLGLLVARNAHHLR